MEVSARMRWGLILKTLAAAACTMLADSRPADGYGRCE
jgi:hypothetical protein